MSFDFNTLLNAAPERGLNTNSRRRLSEEELQNRLEVYERHAPGFEATAEHLEALVAIFHQHTNVFVTGGAGTGKTTFIRDVVIPELDFRNLNWSVTATTGIAGSHLNGKTINSFFGIGHGPAWKPFYSGKTAPLGSSATPGGDVPSPQDMSAEELEAWYAMFFDQWINDSTVPNNVRQGVIRRLIGHEVVIVDEISMCPVSCAWNAPALCKGLVSPSQSRS